METLIFSLTAGGILLLAFLILTNPRKVNLLGNRWLAFLLFTLFFLLIDESLFENKIYEQYPHLLGLDSFFIFATAPALYLSVSHYISLDKKFKKLDFLHFIPTFLFLPIVIFTIFQSAETKLQLIKEAEIPAQNDTDIVLYMLWLQIGIYWILAFLKIINHQKNIKLFASNTSKIDLNWLKYFLFGISFMVLLWVLESLNDSNPIIALMSVSGYFIGTYVLGYFALRQEEIYPFKKIEIEEIKEIIEETPTKQARISEEDLMLFKEKLSYLMLSEKLFLDDTLSLPKLADKIQISSHNLSYVLNEGFNENFFQFVNRYRIEEAKTLLLSPKYQQLSMIGIAYESGFSSKTTFNTTFKKVTGISPSEYILRFSKE
jgi:AraC-like DNA-binding protein